MRLISCYIDNFGLLNDTKIDFSRGMNCFCSLNGTGKTTLTVFIKAMLYGFGDNRASKEENERKKYNPWQGGRYGGSLTFEAGGKTYVAERTFGARQADDVFVLRDATTGGVSNIFTENLGEELFGIDRDGFIRTVFLSERSIAPSARINGSVAARLSDIMGADGDVGNYKKAQELLEERRKVYQKRGGGEIERLRVQIAEYDRRLDELERLAHTAEEKKARLSEAEAQIKALVTEREALDARLSELSAIRDRRKYRSTYDEMQEELRAEKARLDELAKFFGGVIPSHAEIDEARAARLEADMILGELSRTDADTELIRLADFFAPGTSLAEIDEAETSARMLKEQKARLRAIENGEDERSQEMRELFPARLPDEGEIDGHIDDVKASGGIIPTVLLALGVVLVAAGAVLGFVHAALFSICAVGAMLAILCPILRARARAKGVRAARSFLREIAPSASGDVLGALYEKRNDLERYERLRELRDGEKAELKLKIDTGTVILDKFLSKFSIRTDDPEAAIRDLRADYQRYTALSMSEERAAGSRIARLNREKELSAKAKAFVARYPVTSADPFAEIKDKANDYAYCSARVAQLTDQCDNFARVYGITESEEKFDEAEELTLKARVAEIDSELITKRREAAVLSREYEELVNEVDTAEEITAAKSAAEENLASCQRSLDNVKLTKAILEEAYNNMTSRYTGKTRERFLHYVKLISDTNGEFLLDTDFEITRVERGVAREEEAYSRGTKDLYSLAMRLALTDSLYDGELPFLVLDDPFIALDDEKCARAKDMLRAIAKDRQILYFTCSEARKI